MAVPQLTNQHRIKVKITLTHTDFQAAATTNDISSGYSLPAGYMVMGVIIKHTTAFAGTSITAYTLSVGISGDLAKYATAFDVLQAVADTILQASENFEIEDWGSTTDIRVAATSTGANLDASTAGAVEIHLLIERIRTD